MWINYFTCLCQKIEENYSSFGALGIRTSWQQWMILITQWIKWKVFVEIHDSVFVFYPCFPMNYFMMQKWQGLSVAQYFQARWNELSFFFKYSILRSIFGIYIFHANKWIRLHKVSMRGLNARGFESWNMDAFHFSC